MLNVNASYCYVDIRINDIPLIIRNVETVDYNVIPINPFIVESGNQVISVTLRPCNTGLNFLRESDFTMSVSTFMLPETDDYRELATSIEKTEKMLLSFLLDEGMKKNTIISQSEMFIAEVPYVLNAWQSSIDLKEVDDIKSLVQKSYERLRQLIENKEYDLFFELIKEREKNNEISMYYDDSENECLGRRNQIVSLFEEGYILKIPTEYENVRFFADGRLVCCINEDGSSQFSLFNPLTKDEIELEVFFQMKKGSNELTII